MTASPLRPHGGAELLCLCILPRAWLFQRLLALRVVGLPHTVSLNCGCPKRHPRWTRDLFFLLRPTTTNTILGSALKRPGSDHQLSPSSYQEVLSAHCSHFSGHGVCPFCLLTLAEVGWTTTQPSRVDNRLPSRACVVCRSVTGQLVALLP
jgi:hypothetical protein